MQSYQNREIVDDQYYASDNDDANSRGLHTNYDAMSKGLHTNMTISKK